MVVTGIMGETLVFEKVKKNIQSVNWTIHNNKNKKYYDISGKKNDKTIRIQVKTVKSETWSLSLKKFLKFDEQKFKCGEQWVTGIKSDLKKNVDYYVFVYLNNFEEEKPTINKNKLIVKFNYDNIEFYIIKTEKLQKILKKKHKKYLKDKDHKRPINPVSYHSVLTKEDLKNYKNRWDSVK